MRNGHDNHIMDGHTAHTALSRSLLLFKMRTIQIVSSGGFRELALNVPADKSKFPFERRQPSLEEKI